MHMEEPSNQYDDDPREIDAEHEARAEAFKQQCREFVDDEAGGDWSIVVSLVGQAMRERGQ